MYNNNENNNNNKGDDRFRRENPYRYDYCNTAQALFTGGCICDKEEDRSPPYVCSVCPYGQTVTDLEPTIGNITFVRMDGGVPCSRIDELGPLVAFYHGVKDEEGCSDFRDLVTNQCGGCQEFPSAQPTGSVMPSRPPSSSPSISSEPTIAPSSSPTSGDCTDRGFDVTCLFNENPEERRTAVCLQNINEETGHPVYRNACWKNNDLVGILPGDLIGDGSSWTLSSCGCCNRCEIFPSSTSSSSDGDGSTANIIPELHGPHVKHCRRSAVCTPEDDDWEVCFSWGNGVVKTIKVCITHEDGTQEETCVEPFFIPSLASDVVTCRGCTSLN